MAQAIKIATPFTLGCEGAGTITALGDGVQGYEIGQRVWCFADVTRSGWYADEVVSPITSISMAPPSSTTRRRRRCRSVR